MRKAGRAPMMPNRYIEGRVSRSRPNVCLLDHEVIGTHHHHRNHDHFFIQRSATLTSDSPRLASPATPSRLTLNSTLLQPDKQSTASQRKWKVPPRPDQRVPRRRSWPKPRWRPPRRSRTRQPCGSAAGARRTSSTPSRPTARRASMRAAPRVAPGIRCSCCRGRGRSRKGMHGGG
jgi:hypothetical protein